MLSLDVALRLRDLYRSLGSLVAVSRATGYDVETVRRALSRDYDAPPRRARAVALDARLRDLITANRVFFNRNHKNRLTPARAHELLLAYGFRASLRTVERRFAVVSASLGDDAAAPAALRLSPPPGSFQCDFGLVDALFPCGLRSLSLLICSSAYSNGCAAVACLSQDASNLFHGLDACFARLGGVPPFLRFDNLAPAVSSFRNGRHKTDAFSRFELHHGFDSEFCNPAAGWEKGNVENKVQYIRERFFVPVPSAGSLDALNDALALWCRDDMRREHYAKHRPIADLFAEDQAAFLPFRSSFDYWETVSARTDGRGFASYRGNRYFAGDYAANLPVLVRASYNTVQLLTQSGEPMATHTRSYERGEFVQASPDFARQLSRKLNALGNVGRDRADGLALADALRRLDADSRAPFILRFLDGERLSDILDAIEAQRAPLLKYNELLLSGGVHGSGKDDKDNDNGGK